MGLSRDPFFILPASPFIPAFHHLLFRPLTTLKNICRIRILQDHGEVQIAVGPVWDPDSWEAGPWYQIRVIWRFLKINENKLLFYEIGQKTEEQLETYSKLLEPHIPRIIEIFNEKNLNGNRTTLDKVERKYENEMWKRLYRKK